jgi:hypothetical protein
MARQMVARMAREFKMSPEKLLAMGLRDRMRTQAQNADEAKALERKAKTLRHRLIVKKDRMTQERILPGGDTLQKITRYEAHLSRQMLQALHELQRLQATRAGEPIRPPAALDVTLETGGAAAEALGDARTG